MLLFSATSLQHTNKLFILKGIIQIKLEKNSQSVPQPNCPYLHQLYKSLNSTLWNNTNIWCNFFKKIIPEYKIIQRVSRRWLRLRLDHLTSLIIIIGIVITKGDFQIVIQC